MIKSLKSIVYLIVALLPGYLSGTLFFEEPADFNPSIETSICFIQYQDKFLMLHRQDNKPQGNTWGVPGGKLDKSESPINAVVREVFEETHFQITENETIYFGKVFLRTETNDVILHLFLSELPNNPEEIKLAFKEHKGFTWITPKDALDMNLMTDEDKLIELVYGETTEKAP